jgi:GNAT superfamily N-acetyltransferase
MPTSNCAVVRVNSGTLSAVHAPQVDAVFFEASGRAFAPGAEREAFRERWLGRYLQCGSDVVLLALDGEATVAGYLVGALRDPAEQPRFADIAYFKGAFRDHCRRYPAHLHINLAPAYRGEGVGGRLIAAFAACASEAGAPGMHVVTGKGMRNVGFYARYGFLEQGVTTWNGRDIVFLGKDLTDSA